MANATDFTQPLVTLRQLETEIYAVEHVRVVFRGEPTRPVHLGYLARFGGSLQDTGKRLTVGRFFARLNQLVEERCAVKERQPVYGFDVVHYVPYSPNTVATPGHLSRSKRWPYAAGTPLSAIQS